MPPSHAPPPDDELSSDEERLWVFVDRYLAGDAEPHEADAVRAWLAADPSRAELLDDVRRIREVAASRPHLRGVEDAWAALISEFTEHVARPMQPRRFRRALTAWTGTEKKAAADSWPLWLTAAASVLLVAAVATHGWWSDSLLGVGRAGHATVAAAPARAFTTARGQRAEIRLVDGTRVVLAADSRLTVPADYDGVRRAVALEGEAYFDVEHDAEKPFTVGAAHAVLHDLGTRFDVRAYSTDPVVVVVVTQGSVRIAARDAPDSSSQVLARGTAARLDSAGQLSVAANVDTMRYMAWMRGRLVFAATPLAEVAAELGRWYDVDIVITDPELAARQLTATIDDQPLRGVLDQLAVALEIRATRHGRRVTLTPVLNRTRRP